MSSGVAWKRDFWYNGINVIPHYRCPSGTCLFESLIIFTPYPSVKIPLSVKQNDITCLQGACEDQSSPVCEALRTWSSLRRPSVKDSSGHSHRSISTLTAICVEHEACLSAS